MKHLVVLTLSVLLSACSTLSPVYNKSISPAPEEGEVREEVRTYNNCWEVVDGKKRLTSDCNDPLYLALGDTDKDGVINRFDLCPGTLFNTAVTSTGCPVDTDGDGVPDYKDLCPDTPPGVICSASGCGPNQTPPQPEPAPEPIQPAPVIETTTFLKSGGFDFDSAVLKPQMIETLDQVLAHVGRLEGAPYMLTVTGHTDSKGSDAYNQTLSLRRARSVADYLSTSGLSADNIEIHGAGELQPVADNKTPEGRAKNRRVEILIESPPE